MDTSLGAALPSSRSARREAGRTPAIDFMPRHLFCRSGMPGTNMLCDAIGQGVHSARQKYRKWSVSAMDADRHPKLFIADTADLTRRAGLM